MIDNKIPLLALVGPTASGKTEVSVNLAKEFNGEIVSADSMQIYKEFNILSAKPSENQLRNIKHYFIGNISVEERFSVADYVKEAHEVIKDIYGKGKLPIIVGGTGLYIDSLINNIDFNEEKGDKRIREALWERYNKGEHQQLLDELESIDPESAKKIHKNNVKRVIRAIEFFYITNKPISNQIAESKLINSPYNPYVIGINFRDRDVLYERINRRIDKMVDNGLLEEVREASKRNIGKTAREAIGYKEILPYLNGESKLDEVLDKLKIQTRRYAKRQITWFKRNKAVKWFYADDYEDSKYMIEDIKGYISSLELGRINNGWKDGCKKY